MISSEVVAAVNRHLSNRLDSAAIAGKLLAGVIGDAPSSYSKSPRLWNAAFHHVGMNAVYVAFDVSSANLRALLALLRSCDSFLGANITVPHKMNVIDLLDDVTSEAARIQAVNTIVRNAEGKLVGYNTDGEGFAQSLLKPQPGRTGSFLSSLEGTTVLLLGAGGSARAVGFHVARAMAGGRLLICNRTLQHAQSLAQEIGTIGCEAQAVSEANLLQWAPKAGLIVNSTTKGQGGIRRSTGGTVTVLEPYSALAPADPPMFPEADAGAPDFGHRWFDAARMDIEKNNDASLTLARSIPPSTGFYDLIYHPEETVFLRHGRLTGHPTMNGKSMIINQAAVAFCKHICAAESGRRSGDPAERCREIVEVMYSAW